MAPEPSASDGRSFLGEPHHRPLTTATDPLGRTEHCIGGRRQHDEARNINNGPGWSLSRVRVNGGGGGAGGGRQDRIGLQRGLVRLKARSGRARCAVAWGRARRGGKPERPRGRPLLPPRARAAPPPSGTAPWTPSFSWPGLAVARVALPNCLRVAYGSTLPGCLPLVRQVGRLGIGGEGGAGGAE